MIRLEHVTVSYPDGTKAVDDVSFTIEDGETVAVLGANGAGKTSLLKAMLGIEGITEGRIDVDGFVLENKKNRKEKKDAAKEIWKRIGMVFQDPDDQLFMISVLEDVLFGLRNLGVDEEEAGRRAEDMLQSLGIVHLKDKVPGRMSSGEKRLTAIAGVLALEPKHIFFDEPATFLDRRSKRTLIGIIRNIKATKLITTHDMELVDSLCDRVIVLKDGKVVFDECISAWKEKVADEAIWEEWGM